MLVNKLQSLPRRVSGVITLFREGWAQGNNWRHNLGDGGASVAAGI